MLKNTYSFLFACDENYLKHMAVAVKSLLHNNRYPGINVYFASDLSINMLDKVSEIVEAHGANFINVKVNRDLLSGLSQYDYLNISAYYRLLAPEMINENKILYLDSDLIVRRSLKPLFEIDLSNIAVAAVEDPYFDWHKQLEMDATAHYLNSGVMLMNLEYMRIHSIPQKVFDFALRSPNAIKYADQCALNSVLNGNWHHLDPTYNLFGYYWSLKSARKSSYNELQCIEALKDPHVVHFTGAKKPWHYVYHNNRFKAMYWFYRNMTPFASRVADDFGHKSLLELLLNLIFKMKKKILSAWRRLMQS